MRWILRILLVLLLLPFALLAILAVVPERLLADTVERVVSNAAGVDVEIGALSIEVFSMTPGLALSQVNVSDGRSGRILSDSRASVSIAAAELLKARLVLDEIVLGGGPLSIVRYENGTGNWAKLLPEPGNTAPTKAGGGSLPAIRSMNIDQFKIELDDRMTDRKVDVSIHGDGSTTDFDKPLTLVIEGTYNELPLSIDSRVRLPGGLALNAADVEIVQWDVAAQLADTSLVIDGQLDRLKNLEGLDATIVFRAPEMKALGALAGFDVPELPSLAFDGTLRKEGEQFLVRKFTASLGANEVRGDIRLDPTTQPVTAYANIDAEVLDLDELEKAFFQPPEEAAPEEAVEPSNTGDEGAFVLSEDKIDLQPLTRLFNGAVRFTAQRIKSRTLPVESMDVRLEIKGQQIRLVPLDFGLGGGSIEAEVTLDATEAGADGVAEVRIRGIDLQRVLADMGIDNGSVGKVGGRAKYWIKGDSVASLARSADGGLFLLMTGGQLDALLVELAGLDVMESIEELVDPDKDLTQIECGYLDLLSQSGVTTIERMVLGTEDTVFIADGRFDANTEEFDITVEPHPKDISLLSARTSVTISGRPGDIAITPGPELVARAAAIAVLAAVASPAAALLPFLESGGGEQSEYCNGLVSSLDEAR